MPTLEPDNLFGVPLRGPALMTAKAVAQFMEFEVSTIYTLVEGGELEVFRRPGPDKSHIRITRRSVLARLAAMATQPPPETLPLLVFLAGTLSERQRAKLVAELEAAR